jgi:protein-S-isoprenylcysteine O-methyltransferase Ste14
MIWIFTTIYCLWISSEIFLSLYRRSEKKSDNGNKDKGSLGLIWVIIIIANALAYTAPKWSQLPISANAAAGFAGLGLIVIGMILRFSSIASLGKFFTVNVAILEDHKLKQDGLYKYVRHPSYSAALISFIGYGVSLNNWLSVAIVTAAASTVFLVRIGIEERALTDHFGAEYSDYKKRTKRLIPFVY